MDAEERVSDWLHHLERHGYGDDTLVNETLGVTAGDLRTLLALARRIDGLSDDECAICGKAKARHTTNCGVGMCQVYPQFVSKRAMVERLTFAPAIAAGARSAETVQLAQSEGRQSGAKQSPKPYRR